MNPKEFSTIFDMIELQPKKSTARYFSTFSFERFFWAGKRLNSNFIKHELNSFEINNILHNANFRIVTGMRDEEAIFVL